MKRMNVTKKIWLSIGVFVLGFVLSTVLTQLQGNKTEAVLSTTVNSLFPSAQRSQEAEAGFQRMIKGLSDAVMVQDASALDRAIQESTAIVEHLNAVAAIHTSDSAREQVSQLAGSIAVFSKDAQAVYGMLLSDPANLTAETQENMRAMASRMETLKAALVEQRDRSSAHLKTQLNALEADSRYQRSIGLLVFGVTLILAIAIVSLTIRRSIIGPIARVIDGVQEAADEAARASAQVADSGQIVAQDARDQAACLQSTSDSLERISETTRQNASRASSADVVMQEARRTVDRATRVVGDLTQSMKAISESSEQVATVLKSIDEIAFYTNILALNAAVEAARAGEAGAGFSVVADEVRSLAQRAAEAARTSGEIVEKTIVDVANGVEFVASAQNAFGELSKMILSGSEAVSLIASASEDQTRGIAEISHAVARMESVTGNTAANAGQTAESASAMSEQVQKTRAHLDELVAVVGVHSRASSQPESVDIIETAETIA